MNGTDGQIRFRDTQIEMAHGAGGKATRRLIEGLIRPVLDNPLLHPLDDAAVLELDGRRLAVTTDSFVVRPLRFPGGSIGKLAVNGTINDLAVAGARPLVLTSTLILEAGLPADELQHEIQAMADAARDAGVAIVAGDTKVVEHGKAEGMYITIAGIGIVDERVHLDPAFVKPGDTILLSGPIGDHGISILLARGELELEGEIRSDSRPVTLLVQALIDEMGEAIRWMRDPTRGGVASALNELARDAKLGISIQEEQIPIRPAVRGACEILGLEPLHIANEGQFLAVVDGAAADRALEALRRAPGGSEAAIIGEVTADNPRMVTSDNAYGGRRIVDMLVGDPLPRIC